MKLRHAAAAIVVPALCAGIGWIASRTEDAPRDAAASPSPAAGEGVATPRRRARIAGTEPVAAAPPAATPAREEDAVIATLEGRVVDAVDASPVAGAQLRWGYVDPSKPGLQQMLWGETKADGALAFVYPRTGWWAPERREFADALWVAADGYATAKLHAPLSPVVVRLERRPADPPRDLRFRAFRGDGAPWTGLVRVEASGPFGDAVERMCALASDDGRFTLLAVPGRHRRVRIDARAPWADVPAEPAKTGEIELWAVRNADPVPDTPQRALVFEDLPADAAPLVEARVDTHECPISWRLRMEGRAVEIVTPRDVPYRWRVTIARAEDARETRDVLLLGETDGFCNAATGPNAELRKFPVQDGAIVVPWDELLPPK